MVSMAPSNHRNPHDVDDTIEEGALDSLLRKFQLQLEERGYQVTTEYIRVQLRRITLGEDVYDTEAILLQSWVEQAEVSNND